ncbi:hypothetical protein [Halomarina rubra]|uniref:Uncharacterized protein n=1 Tax=Halomarina rubra TaxID=2071873 RepID=A0ABD6B0N2_9EURY|nr:hypothetical protein [Halomarina rubra]
MASAQANVPETVEKNVVLKHCAWNRMHRHNQNWMAAFCGETGSGKSMAALRVCEVLDPDFGMDQVAFSVEEVLELVVDDSYGPGSMILFEEASVGASNHNWYEKANQVLGQVMETWRHQNRGLVFTLPAFSRLDKTARSRVHNYAAMKEIDRIRKLSAGKFYNVEEDEFSGELRRPFPRINGVKYEWMKFNLPSADLTQRYEARKSEFTTDLNQELLDELREENAEEEDDELTPKDVVTEIDRSNSLSDYIKTIPSGDYIDRDLLRAEYGVSEAESKQVKSLLVKEFDLEVM